MKQSNVQRGPIQRLANQDLAGLRGYLCRLVNQDGVAQVGLPVAVTDICQYFIHDEAVEGQQAGITPLHPEQNVRLPLIGACTIGDVLTLADPTVATQPGKVNKLPAGVGTYRQVAVAEENGVDGQFVLCRPIGQTLVTVSA